MSSKSFLTSYMMLKNDILTSMLLFFLSVLSEVQSRQYPADPPPLFGFTAITEHPSAGEVLPGCGIQCGVSQVNIPVSFGFQAALSAVGGEFSVGPALLLFLSVLMLLHHSGQSETTAVY
jgi:hypothetical protein